METTNDMPDWFKPKNTTKYRSDEYLSLFYRYNTEIESAYIISLEGHEVSQRNTEACVKSCVEAGMPYKIFYGYDGTNNEVIKTPDHLKEKEYMKWFKLMDHGLTCAETATVLSHVALWAHCVTIDKPIMVLEHDAHLFKAVRTISYFNCLEYLGDSSEIEHFMEVTNASNPNQIKKYKDLGELYEHYYRETYEEGVFMMRLPMINTANHNYTYPLSFHAYVIDPLMAKKLLSSILFEGIVNPADVLFDISKFECAQMGVFACQSPNSEQSTIAVMKEEDKFITINKDNYNLDFANETPRKNFNTIPSLSK